MFNKELGTENAVGHAIRASGIPRTDIFVTTKLPWHHANRVEESINDSLQYSGLDYFDLVSEANNNPYLTIEYIQ